MNQLPPVLSKDSQSIILTSVPYLFVRSIEEHISIEMRKTCRPKIHCVEKLLSCGQGCVCNKMS